MRALFYAAFFAAALAASAHAEEPFRRTVTVSGEGKVEAAPDRAVLPIAIETKDKQVAEAKRANDALTEKLLKVAGQYGIPKEKLKTSGIFVSPQYRWEEKTHKQVFETYVVNRSLEITIDALEKTEKIIAAVTEAGIDRVQGIQFTLANPEALEAEARTKAVRNAQARAQALAEAAGVKLGRVLTITSGGGGYAPPPMPMRAMAAKADMAESAPPTLPGVSSIEQQVTVVYELQ